MKKFDIVSLSWRSKYLIRLVPLLLMMTYARNKIIRQIGRKYILKIIELDEISFTPPKSSTRMIIGGDVAFDTEIRNLPFLGVDGYIDKLEKDGIFGKIRKKITRFLHQKLFLPDFVCTLNRTPFQEPLVKNPENETQKFLSQYYKDAIKFNPAISSSQGFYDYPFQKISPLFKSKDLVVVNLETPLTNNNRARGFFISNPEYAKVMKSAGVSLVSLANNHIFDAGESGFIDTVRNLDEMGIYHTGDGRNLKEARAGKRLQINGMDMVFLSYTQWCIHRYASVAYEYPGILPMDRKIIIEDTNTAKENADFVFVSLHWGYEDQPNIHPKQVGIAHEIIDAGADAIIGHHPHVPHGIEIYKKRPIFYSLGNFIFGHAKKSWIHDNLLAELIIDQKQIKNVLLYPISGKGQELMQPIVVEGERAKTLLCDLQIKSIGFGTKIFIQNNIGNIRIT